MTVIDVGAPADVAEVQEDGARHLPAQIGVLPLRDAVTFPELVIPLNIGQERSVQLVNDVLQGDRSIVLIAGRDPEVETPGPEELYDVGVLGTIARMVRLPDGTPDLTIAREMAAFGMFPSPLSAWYISAENSRSGLLLGIATSPAKDRSARPIPPPRIAPTWSAMWKILAPWGPRRYW